MEHVCLPFEQKHNKKKTIAVVFIWTLEVASALHTLSAAFGRAHFKGSEQIFSMRLSHYPMSCD